MRRNKIKDVAEDVTKDVKKAAKKAAKKKGFISKMFSRALVIGAIGAGVKYFTDSTAGSARREKVLALVGK